MMKKLRSSPFLKLAICTLIGTVAGYFLDSTSLGIGIGFALGIGFGFIMKNEK